MGYQSYEEWKDETAEFFDHLSDEVWKEKYGYSCEKARCFGWYMEDELVRIDDEGNVFVKSPGNKYTDYKRGNTIKDHRWFHSIISRPEVNEITKEQYDNYGVTWRYAGLPGDPSGSEIVYLTAANQ